MTCQEKWQELQDEFQAKSNNHLKADLKLSGEKAGFINKQFLDEFFISKRELENAAKSYYDFLSFYRDSGKTPSDIWQLN